MLPFKHWIEADRTVGLQLIHSHVKPSGGRETKTVEWTPATSDCDMELKNRGFSAMERTKCVV